METISRVEVLDYVAFGRRVVEWSLDPSKRPRDLQTLKAELVNVLSVPDRITHLEYVDSDMKTLLIRIPVKEMVEESLQTFQGAGASGSEYPAPPFYRALNEPNPPMSNLDFLHSRIADYTISQCK